MQPTTACAVTALALCLGPAAALGADWPLFGHDHHNSNFALTGGALTAANTGSLRRAWETFNDDTLVGGPPPGTPLIKRR